jgi:hypothetical protein
MERRWRFIYDRDHSCHWAWQLMENTRVRIESLCAFSTLDSCITHARENGFSFAQRYDILYRREQEGG